MPLPKMLEGRMRLPAVAAPQFLVSGPDYVVEACKAGIVGAFPALNQRSSEGFESWLAEIAERLDGAEGLGPGGRPAPYGVNLIAHRTNPRLEPDLAIAVKHKVPIIITSLGAISDLVDAVHSYGGIVLHDVTNIRHARKAAGAGVDGLVLVCAGAGGHAGVINPFALLPEVRAFFDRTIVLAGCISHGRAIAAAEMMGADLAYLGTRFIATEESMASDDYKRMVIESRAADIVYTPAISGVPASFLRQSLVNAGLDPDELPSLGKAELGEELTRPEKRPWKNIWSAGQGVGTITDAPSIAELVGRFEREYLDAVAEIAGRSAARAAE